jgi:N-acetylglutamate synthase-like GNAT family acetyltransferase
MIDWATSVRVTPRPSCPKATALLKGAGSPTSELTPAHMEHFCILGFNDASIGLVGLELYGRDALLRCLVVALQWQKSGLGEHARALGVVSLYLLTTETSAFFSCHGFSDMQRMLAIELIRATREFADIWPTNSAFMLKQL